MKPEPSLPKLPTISELLKHPTVERIVDRVNQTTIAKRAAGFVEELQSNLQKGGAQGVVPSIQQMAERLARRLMEPAEQSHSAINATGAIWGDRWPAPPLAEAAVHEMMQLASEYQVSPDALSVRVEHLLTELTGAEAAWVGSSFEAVAEVVRESGEKKVEIVAQAGLVDPADFGLTQVDTIQTRLSSATKVVVCEGSGLLGGPRCAIVVGSRKQIADLNRPLCEVDGIAEPLTLAALAATLEIYQTADQAIYKIPALQLLSTPLENLEQRCERLAPLMAESDLLAEARPTQCDSAWYDTGEVKYAGPTWALKLSFADGMRAKVAARFQACSPVIVGREQQDALWLDLRAVFPRWDQQLVTALE